jgi:hypothetical protein
VVEGAAAGAPEAEAWVADVEARVGAELGGRVVGWTELGTGTNNRLYRLELAEGAPLLAKRYVRDRWDRLGTEFPALALLAARGVGGVPRPLLRSDAHLYGVYSFEPGVRKAPSELTEADARAAAGLAARLHGFGPDGGDGGASGEGVAEGPAKQERGSLSGPSNGQSGGIGLADARCLSVADQVRMIGARLRAYEETVAAPGCDAAVRAFAAEVDVPAAVARLVAAATEGLTEDGVAAALPRAAWRLNSYDYGPHNWLFDEGGGMTVVDFEGAGWDDPARMVMGCVSHIGSQGLSAAAVAAFLGRYAEARGLSAAEMRRFERVGMLFDAEWAAVFASAMAPDVVEAKRFATPGLDLAGHLRGCMAGVRDRLARAERGGGYRFPQGAAG